MNGRLLSRCSCGSMSRLWLNGRGCALCCGARGGAHRALQVSEDGVKCSYRATPSARVVIACGRLCYLNKRELYE